jgi:hypothetical protein
MDVELHVDDPLFEDDIATINAEEHLVIFANVAMQPVVQRPV